MTKKINLRNVVAIAICLTGMTMFSGCDKDPIAVEKEGGVVINNVCWAKCNVGALGTFVANPEDAGMFYQWNRPKAWASTGEVTGWDKTIPAGTTWERANDPSPAGWRVPTETEIRKLLDENKVKREFVEQNGVKGCKFTDLSTNKTVFFPINGYRYKEAGEHFNQNRISKYWGKNVYYTNNAYMLNIDNWTSSESDDGVFLSGTEMNSGCLVRPVAE